MGVLATSKPHIQDFLQTWDFHELSDDTDICSNKTIKTF